MQRRIAFAPIRLAPALIVLLVLCGCGGDAPAVSQGHDVDVSDGVDVPDGEPSDAADVVPDSASDSSTPAETTSPADTVTSAGPGDRLFAGDRVATVAIELDAASWQAILADPEAEAWQTGALVYEGERFESVRVRVKGNSSLRSVARTGSHRFPFKVDLDDLVAGQALDGEEKLVFNNGFKDPTSLREALGYELMRALGVPAPRTAFVDLTVAGEHLGLYTMVEVVDKRFLRRHFPDDDGDLYKPERGAGTLAYAGDSPANYPDMELSSNEDTSDGSTFVSLVKALSERRPADALDVDLALRYLAVSTLLTNLDSYQGTGHNYYLYEVDGRFTVIPWDMNEAFAVFTCGCDRAGLIGLEIDTPTCGTTASRPLIAVLLADPTRHAAYRAHLETLIAADGPFGEGRMSARIDALAALIRPTVLTDPTRFFPVAAFENNLESDVTLGRGPTGGLAIGLMAFVRERRAAVRAQLDGASPASASAGACPGFGPPP